MDFHGENAAEPSIEDGADIAVQRSAEDRLQIRAYNHWVSLLNGNPFPPIDDLDLDTLDLGPRSFLLDLTCGVEDPAITFVGKDLRDACRLGYHEVEYVSEVLRGSLLSRLTDHYLQILANSAPIGFEAEFTDERGVEIKYRGILMPFSSNGDTIDFICGAISWKEVSQDEAALLLQPAPEQATEPAIEPATPPAFQPSDVLELSEGDEFAFVERDADADAGLADRLAMAREGADAVKNADSRSRAALYQTLGLAYDFAVSSEAFPDDYRELLSDSGMKVQDRAPMTPIVKLVFGIDYDKTRLTEFACALEHGRRQNLAVGAFSHYLEGYQGGLKAIVCAERQARRGASPAAGPDHRLTLKKSKPLAFVDIEGNEEFVLLLGRRDETGRVAILSPVKASEASIERAIRDAASTAQPAPGAASESRAARLFNDAA